MEKHDDAQNHPLPWGRGKGRAALSQDPFFKEFFKDRDFICSLLTELLPIPSLKTLDFAKMDLMSSNFIKDSLGKQPLRQLYNDLLWRLPWEDGKYTYICLLLEMQSKTDKSMAKRVGDYILGLYNELEKRGEIKAGQNFPFVLPIVIYNGEQKWSAKRDLGELISEVPEDLEHLRIKLAYELLDIRHTKESSLKDGATSWLIRLLNAEDLEEVGKAVNRLRELLQGDDKNSIRHHLSVLVSCIRKPDNKDDGSCHDELEDTEENGMEEDWIASWRKRIYKGDMEKLKAEGMLKATFSNLKNLVTWRYGSYPAEVATSLDAKKGDLNYLEQAMHWVLDCSKLDEFKQKLKEHDTSVGTV
ncbi:MAG TPA: hypothetical protein DCL74_05605 [Succinivibrionaceae bacterium]|nr:hypothetical protein [Succinivibrionaceae bacterium]